MKKIVFVLFAISSFPLFSQEGLVEAFIDNFNKGSDETKIEVLQDSAGYGPATMGPLYMTALEYVLNNSDQLDLRARLRELSVLAVRLTGVASFSEALPVIWELFLVDTDTSVRIAILNALKTLDTQDPVIPGRLNTWVETQNNIFKAGGGVNAQVLAEALTVLGVYGRSESFPVILSSSVLGIHPHVTKAAKDALLGIEGDTSQLIMNVLKTAPFEEKLVALTTARQRENISAEDLATIASEALSIGVHTSTAAERELRQLRQLRILAVQILTQARWGEATKDMIAHFDLTISEYDRGAAVKSTVLEAISGLGAMGTLEAAVRLGVYLDVTNSFVEHGEHYDEQIVLAVVHNLGALGSKETLQPLLYVQYLDYSKSIKTEAQRAILAIRSK
ncbi:MAG: hypothetical protein JXB03_00910 [Spirochaetales bacterium]|nr:hypothetical protein [Spirochaetales bacterium]